MGNQEFWLGVMTLVAIAVFFRILMFLFIRFLGKSPEMVKHMELTERAVKLQEETIKIQTESNRLTADLSEVLKSKAV